MSIDVDMQAQSRYSSLPTPLGALPLVYNPVWTPPGSPANPQQWDGYAPQVVYYWLSPNWHEDSVNSEHVAGDLSESLLDEAPIASFEYPYEEKDGCLNFDAAFESIHRSTELVQQATLELAQESLIPQSPAFHTFAWAQSPTSPRLWVNPRYISSSKHAHVESAIISPRTLKRSCIPSPIDINIATPMPLAIRTASTLRADAAPFTPRWSVMWEAPDSPSVYSKAEDGQRNSVEATAAYAHGRGHSAAAIELIQNRLRMGKEESNASRRRRLDRQHASDASIAGPKTWPPGHRKSYSVPAGL